jgi:hypothetical protein
VTDPLDVGAGRPPRERHAQRVEVQIGAHVIGELPADDPAAEGVDDEAEEGQAFPAAQVGEVGDPQLIGPARGEVAIDEIGRAQRPRIGGWWSATACRAASRSGSRPGASAA